MYIYCCRHHTHFRPVRAPGCKNWPAPFPGRMSYKATKPGLVSVLYLSMRYMVLLFIRAPFYVLLVFVAMCSVFWLFWLSVLAKWLARKTPLRKPNRGEGIVSRKPRPKSAHDFLGLLYCFIVFYVFMLSPAPIWHIILLLWRDICAESAVKPQTNKQTNIVDMQQHSTHAWIWLM